MKITWLVLIFIGWSVTSHAQSSSSRIFLTEPQNEMAREIPKHLLTALMNGDIQAYYPNNFQKPVSYVQVLNHFASSQLVNAQLQAAPDWFCLETSPRVDPGLLACFSVQMELLEEEVIDPVSRQPKEVIRGLRLLFDSNCHPAGYDSPGPVFKMKDIEMIRAKAYPIQNTRNQAIQYAIKDVLYLRLFRDRRE